LPSPSPSPSPSPLPPGATDCHAHVLDADVPSSVPGAAYPTHDAPLTDYLAMLDAAGLERGVLVTASTYGADNDVLVEALRAAPDRLRGVAVVTPDCPDDLLTRLHVAGVRGCRVQARVAGGVDLHALPGLAARVTPLGWHLEVWTDLREHLGWLPAAVAASPAPVVLDHLAYLPADVGVGDPAVRELVAMAADGAVWVALSGAYRLLPGATEVEAARAVRPRVEALLDQAPGQLVWGSDWPYVAAPGPLPTAVDMRQVLDLWLPDERRRHQVLVDNPTRLYGFGAGTRSRVVGGSG
jgi:predicted TIM-barrel fold metal-dependent hydrolase